MSTEGQRTTHRTSRHVSFPVGNQRSTAYSYNSYIDDETGPDCRNSNTYNTALGQAWMAVVAAEIFGVPGLGHRMIEASSLLATDIVVVYMLTMAALYGLLDFIGVDYAVDGREVEDKILPLAQERTTRGIIG